MADSPDLADSADGPLDDEQAVFQARARRWLEANAIQRGAPGDFSASHLFTAKSLDDYWVRER